MKLLFCFVPAVQIFLLYGCQTGIKYDLEQYLIVRIIYIYQSKITQKLMNREIITGSRIIAFEDLRRNWMKHQSRVKHIKPTINTYNSLAKINLCKAKINVVSSLDRQLENKALLKKLTERNLQKNQNFIQSTPRTLIKNHRKKYYEDYHIKLENQGLFRRLRSTKPMYQTVKLKQERKSTEKLINTISKFGYKNLKPNKTMVKFEMTNDFSKYHSKAINSRIHTINSRIDTKLDSQENQQNNSSLKINELENQLLKKVKVKPPSQQKKIKSRYVELGSFSLRIKAKISNACVKIDIKSLNKENQNIQDMEVEITTKIFNEKFHGDFDSLIQSIKYNSQDKVFYLL